MGKRIDLSGQVFARLTVLEFAGKNERGEALWLCGCGCGGKVTAPSGSLRSGNTKSCGCLKKEATAKAKTVHGMRQHRGYNIWANMKQRCDNPLASHYELYGGRGITYEPDWGAFENFWADMGDTYGEHLSLDRLDNDKGYSKSNCRWVTDSQQKQNKRKRKGREFIGVSTLTSGKFYARCTVGGKQTYLGTFPTALEAATAYDNAVEPLIGNRPNNTPKGTNV